MGPWRPDQKKRKEKIPVYDGTGNDDGFMLGVGVSRDVGKLEEFFNDRKYRCDQFTLMINCLLDHALAL